MVGRDRLAVVGERDHRAAADQIFRRHVGRVAVDGMREDVGRRRLDPRVGEESSIDTPSQAVSNLLHFVTQWMSRVTAVVGSEMNSRHDHA